MTLQEYDVVRLRRPLFEHNLSAGALGTVVMVFQDPPAFEVEFCDKDGVTLALVTLKEPDLEKLHQ
ncbi:DUF4926 domain-containing protein [Vulgatibacter incomptus]|uniref:DUF4926 domain-containing protein n=1 Tax=Vulgatibacter incomptus TaxID=1391653 RepID=UPI000680734E|nr:DUF4926 domain-containing protein [Vulgatibacter incomptus]